MSPVMIAVAAFVGVTAMVGGLALALRQKPGSKVEDRLDLLTGVATPTSAKGGPASETSDLSQPLDGGSALAESFFERFGNFRRLFEQADTSLTIGKLLLISGVVAVLGVAVGIIMGVHVALIPVVGMFMGSVPLMWLLYRRKRRLKAFAAQLPDALEMLARSLRAGQSLGFGFNMVAGEMGEPIAKEFGQVFEEQNLGIPLDDCLNSLTERVPNLDLKFFVTAVILQRQTGGDLAEILDKIGELVRDRFRIWGQVQALTGEGRLSGAVLLALPLVLFGTVYQLNPDYIMVLFTDPMGKKMLAGAIFLQLLGALTIRKIINIKV
ncbi:MAG: type II secretion system F family protein [Candidatus Nealsonbacteria bacterium]|nr:type II secretion system F family protein [Candidatus Nealsonbacteria bacterium]